MVPFEIVQIPAPLISENINNALETNTRETKCNGIVAVAPIWNMIRMVDSFGSLAF